MKKYLLIAFTIFSVSIAAFNLSGNQAQAWTINGQKAYDNASHNVQKEGKKIENNIKKGRDLLEQIMKEAEKQNSNGANNAQKR